MRIDSNAFTSASSDIYTAKPARSSAPFSASSALSTGGSDKTSLSHGSDLLNLAKTLIPGDRLARFQSLSTLVNAGGYATDSSAVSHSLVDEHLTS